MKSIQIYSKLKNLSKIFLFESFIKRNIKQSLKLGCLNSFKIKIDENYINY